MTTLKQSIQTLLEFGNAQSLKDLKRLYWQAASSNKKDISMAKINAIWNTISQADENTLLGFLPGTPQHQKLDEQFNGWKKHPLHEGNASSLHSVQTMAGKLHKVFQTSNNQFQWFDGLANTAFIEDPEGDKNLNTPSLLINTKALQRYINIQDVTHAFKKEECQGYVINIIAPRDNDPSLALSFLLNEHCADHSPQSLWKWLRTLNTQQHKHPLTLNVDQYEFQIRQDSSPGKDVYSPFNLSVFKPLIKPPTKWTVVHLRKLLANGQFTQFKQNEYLTDDYALDCANNYSKGYFDNPLAMFVTYANTRPRYLDAKDKEGIITLTFGLHSNDSCSLVVDLDMRYPLIDIAAMPD